MKAISTVTAAALLAATVAVAQTPSTQQPTDPSAASSPHQRDAVGNGTNEAGVTNGANPSDASTMSQRQTMRHETAADLDSARTAGATPATFVMHASQDGMTEVALAKLALTKSNNPQVKTFAQKMEEDHTKADDQLAAIAQAKGFKISDKLDARHRGMVKQLSAKSGAAFDSAYAMHMVKAHDQAIALFESAAKSSDSQLAEFAENTLPTLQEHKQLADNLRASVGTRTASAGRNAQE